MGSFTEHHIDAAGFCTCLLIVNGAKVWWLQADEVEGLPQAPGRDWNIKQGKWVPLYLKPGDILCVDKLSTLLL